MHIQLLVYQASEFGENLAEGSMCIMSLENRLDLLFDLHAFSQGTKTMDIDTPREEIGCHELGCLFCLKGSINDSLQLHEKKEVIAQKEKNPCSPCLWQMG